MNSSSWQRKLFAAFLLIFFILLLFLANYRYAKISPGGSDFLPRWLGTRLLITEGQNPYGPESTLAIQTMIYGGPAGPNSDQVLFVYPLYSSIIFAPFALIGDYIVARTAWMTMLQAALVIIALLSLRLANWRPPSAVIMFILLFILLWYHSVRPLINGNAAIMSALFVTVGLIAIKEERDVLGGISIALSTIKPQIVILFVPLVFIWAIKQRRWTLLASLTGSFSVLVIASAILVPTWIIDNLTQIQAYPTYTLPGTPVEIFSEVWPDFGLWLGMLTSVVIGLLLLWIWRQSLGEAGEKFVIVAWLTLVATNLVGVRTTTANYIVLFPAIILVFATLSKEYGKFGNLFVATSLLIFLFGLWLLFLTTRSGRMQNPVMFFPLPIYLMITLLIVYHSFRVQDKNGDAHLR